MRDGSLLRALRRAFRQSTREYRQQLTVLGLTGRQAAVVLAVSDRPGLGVGPLAEAIGADAATVSDLVDRLVERGVLRREPDPADRRRTRLHLTDAAAALEAAVRKAHKKTDASLVQAIGPEHAQALTSLLDELADRLAAGRDD